MFRRIGCVLAGGRSSRMGTPKHLLEYNGRTWLTCIAESLAGFCDEVVVVGTGEIDGPWRRLPDVAGCCGPMAGIMAAMREYASDLLVCACDMPEIGEEALSWLIAAQQPGDWAVVPEIEGRLQPLFAIYSPPIMPVLEDLARRHIFKMQVVCRQAGVRVVQPPLELCHAWKNINDPRQLADWQRFLRV